MKIKRILLFEGPELLLGLMAFASITFLIMVFAWTLETGQPRAKPLQNGRISEHSPTLFVLQPTQ